MQTTGTSKGMVRACRALAFFGLASATLAGGVVTGTQTAQAQYYTPYGYSYRPYYRPYGYYRPYAPYGYYRRPYLHFFGNGYGYRRYYY